MPAGLAPTARAGCSPFSLVMPGNRVVPTARAGVFRPAVVGARALAAVPSQGGVARAAH